MEQRKLQADHDFLQREVYRLLVTSAGGPVAQELREVELQREANQGEAVRLREELTSPHNEAASGTIPVLQSFEPCPAPIPPEERLFRMPNPG